MKKHLGMAMLLAVMAICSFAGAAEAVRFKFEDLGNLGGDQNYSGSDVKEFDINDAGQVVGYSFTPGGERHAFVRSPGQTMVDLNLGLPAGTTASRARSINNSAVVAGYFLDATGDHACVWVPSAGGYLWNSLGGDDSRGCSINDAGDVVGLGYIGLFSHAYVKPYGLDAVDLGIPAGYIESRATGINNAKTIVGYLTDGEGITTASVWSYSGSSWGAATSLFGVADSKALAINQVGQAAGFQRLSGTYHAVLQSPGQPLQDLGGLLPGFGSQAFDVNDAGWVVGYGNYYDGERAFLWTNAWGMQDLNALVVNLPTGVKLIEAQAINNRGEITGYMLKDGLINRVFKLTPVGGSPAIMLLLD